MDQKPFFERASYLAANKTHFMGRLSCSYSDLVDVFGHPDGGDNEKTDVEWILQFNTPDGPVIATIYNWDNGFASAVGGPTPVATTMWHVGGFDRICLTLIKHAMLITPRVPV
jgi:hypothetical protein